MKDALQALLLAALCATCGCSDDYTGMLGGYDAGVGGGANQHGDCSVGGSGSSLLCADGRECAHLLIPEQKCAFTQAEALAGIDVSYQIVIDQAIPDVTPKPLDTGGCAKPDASGLIVFEELKSTTGSPEHYCLCDIGSCASAPKTPVTLAAGTFEKKLQWDGRSFNGPSDSHQQPGDPFPPELYVLVLRAEGEQIVNGATQSFYMGGAMTLRIKP